MSHRREIPSREVQALLGLDAAAAAADEQSPAEADQDGPEVRAMMDMADIRRVLRTACCKRGCMKQFDEDEILRFREPLFSAGRLERLKLHASNPSVKEQAKRGPGRPPAQPLRLSNDSQYRQICVEAYHLIMAIGSNVTWTSILALAKRGDSAMHLAHAEPVARDDPKTRTVLRYLALMKERGQALAPRGRAQHAQTMLVGFMSWDAVYADYVAYCKATDEEGEKAAASRAWFNELRSKHFHELCHDHESDLPGCRVCLDLKEWIAQQPGSVDGNAAARHLLRAHEEVARVDRKAFVELQAVCRTAPSDWLFLKIDGSPFTGLPIRNKNVTSPALDYSLIGVHLEHEDYRRLATYFVLASAWDAASGCDYWVSAATAALRDYFARRAADRLPRARRLMLHTDNPVSENKNRFVISFVGDLIASGWFEEVYWHNALEYHGSNELDRMFGVLKVLGRSRRVMSVLALQELLQGHKVGGLQVHVEELTHVLNVHAMAADAQFPSGVQDFHFLHFYRESQPNQPRHILLRARKFLAKSLDEPADMLAWVGTEHGAPWLVHHAGQPPHPMIWCGFRAEAMQEAVHDVRAQPALIRDAAEQQWWDELCVRYSALPGVSWVSPCEIPFRPQGANALGVEEVVSQLNLKLSEVERIRMVSTAHFYSSSKAKRTLAKLSDAELRRRKLGVYALPRAVVAEDDAGAAATPAAAKRRRCIVDSGDEDDEAPGDETYKG